MFTIRKVLSSVSAPHLLIAAGLLCAGSVARAGGRAVRARPAPASPPAAKARAVPAPAPAVAAILPCVYAPGVNPPAGAANRLCSPPPPPANATVDTNSDQLIYGVKYFAQPITGDLEGAATYANEFTGQLSGDVTGGQGETRIANVPVSALPSIGYGPGNSARVSYVFADADPADARADGSIAHPYPSLSLAAQNARNGDRIIVQGVHSGAIVFDKIVTLEGAGPDATVLYGTIEFAGYGSSRVRGMRINCTSASACVLNRAVSGGALNLENVVISQSGEGSALTSVSGPVTAIRSGFHAENGGVGVLLDPYADGESRFSGSVIDNPRGGIALAVTGRTLRIDDSAVTTAGKDAAIDLTEVERFTARGVTAASGGVVIHLRNTRTALVSGGVFTPGPQSASVNIENDPIATFAATRGPGLLFVNNTFESDVADVFACGMPASVMTSGNLVPMFNSPSPVDPPTGASAESACLRTTFAGF